jgi:Fic-DOC domain mobile mystery protein B
MAIWKAPKGATPIDDASGLLIPSITTLADCNRYEAENIRKATVKYLAGKPSKQLAAFNITWAYRVHADMFGDVWDWAGKKRTSVTNIGIAPIQIETQLFDLFGNINYWSDEAAMSPEEVSARIHHRAVFIHPFKNGNGRWSRMLANIWLKRNDHPVVVWPEHQINKGESAIRDTYIDAIRAADDGKFAPLIRMHRQYGNRGQI